MCLQFCEDYFGVHIFIIIFLSSWKNTLFSVGRIVTRLPRPYYSTCRQVELSFLGMPQIAHFQVEKWKSSLPWEGGSPPPTPSPARSLRSLAKIVPPPPPMFWLITPLVQGKLFRFREDNLSIGVRDKFRLGGLISVARIFSPLLARK